MAEFHERMAIEERIRILFSSNDEASGKRHIRYMEKLVEDVVNDSHYRTVWMPCLPMEEKPPGQEDQQTKDAVEEAAC